MPTLNVKLKRDHLQRIAKVTPKEAVSELIWNGLDAGATLVRVEFDLGSLGAITSVRVTEL